MVSPVLFLLSILVAVSLLAPLSARAETRTVRVGIYQNNPKVFVDEDGQPQGVFVDIINEIARQEGWNIEYVESTWAENLERLERGEIDVLVDMSYSPERAKRFTLGTAPVLQSWLDVYSRREVEVSAISEFAGKRIAVLEDSVQERFLTEEIMPAYNIDFTLMPYPDYAGSIAAVESDEADMLVASRFFFFSPDRPDDILPANVVLRPENLHFAFPKDVDPALVAAIDQGVTRMKNDPDSAFYLSLQRWLDVKPDVGQSIPAYIKIALAGITGLLSLIALFALALRRQVAARTRELSSSNEAIRRSDRLLRETQSLARLGGWEYNCDDGRLEWTDEVYNIYGVGPDYDPCDIRRNISYYAPEDAPVIEKAFQQAIEHGKPYDLELQLIREEGERIWVRTTGQPVVKDGKVVRVAGNIIDITRSRQLEEERRQLREQLELSQKMELVGRLAGGVAHDFNNMLNVILGYAELALERISPEDPLHHDLLEVQSAARRSTAITRQLLAFARKQAIAPEAVDLNQAVSSMLKMIQRLIGEDIRLTWLPGDDLWPVKIDPAQVDQILANLCVNARDAIAGVGTITISTRNIAGGQAGPFRNVAHALGDCVLLTVQDSGSGMNDETMARIFEPYFTTKERGHGTGLGLATVFGIVKQNDGFIEARSEPGNGTTFAVYLRRHTATASDAENEEISEAPAGQGETIMVVEDEAAIMNLARTLLEGLGYKVLTAGSPMEALRLSEEYGDEIHLLLTDVILPGLNGRELSGQIGAARPAIKILFMSGYTADVIASRGVLDEGVQFIQKPFTRDDLANKVRTLLDRA
ncbi:MAG: ATP-binding protein [Thermoleophilia bacterium]